MSDSEVAVSLKGNGFGGHSGSSRTESGLQDVWAYRDAPLSAVCVYVKWHTFVNIYFKSTVSFLLIIEHQAMIVLADWFDG